MFCDGKSYLHSLQPHSKCGLGSEERAFRRVTVHAKPFKNVAPSLNVGTIVNVSLCSSIYLFLYFVFMPSLYPYHFVDNF